MLLFPISITIAILRYQLFDIDVIIRRTLVYGLLTAALVVIYFGSVVLLQQAFLATTGERSQAAVVFSTLAIAALFTPLRKRIQDFIDRRFYRQKYNSEQALAQFATAARSQADLDHLVNALTEVTQNTLQPQQVNLWLKSIGRPKVAR